MWRPKARPLSARQPNPVSTHPNRNLPNARLRRLLLALEAELGRGAVMSLLRQARLRRFTTGLPENNHDLRVSAAEYAALVRAVEAYFGRGARGTLLRVGARAFQQLLRQSPATAWGLRLVLAVRPPSARAERVLNWLAVELARPAGRVVVRREGRQLVMLDYEADSTAGLTRAAPACWLTVGEIQAALRWATGRDYEVVESECRGQGQPACRFEVIEPNSAA